MVPFRSYRQFWYAFLLYVGLAPLRRRCGRGWPGIYRPDGHSARPTVLLVDRILYSGMYRLAVTRSRHHAFRVAAALAFDWTTPVDVFDKGRCGDGCCESRSPLQSSLAGDPTRKAIASVACKFVRTASVRVVQASFQGDALVTTCIYDTTARANITLVWPFPKPGSEQPL